MKHAHPRTTRVLVAEDDPSLRRFVTDSLRREGYEVVAAADGATALGYVRACEQLDGVPVPGVVVADIRMPRLDGLELLASLNDRDTCVPVILITAFGDAETHATARRLGAIAMLDKPFEIEQLTAAVASVAPRPEPRAGVSTEDVACIAHDLKNPLFLIDLGLETLAQIAREEGACSGLEREIDRIRRTTRYMDRLVHDLVEVPQVEEGTVALQRSPIALSELVETALDLSLARRDRARIDLVVEADVTVNVDRARLERVVANLVQNSAKFALRDTPIHVRIEREAARARVSVSNAGPGVRSDEVARVFERFRRGRSSASTEGSGLGLYISKRIVEAHGGAIGVEPLPTGVRFYFELPVDEGARADRLPSAQPCTEHGLRLIP